MAAPGRYVREIEDAGIPFHPVPMTRIISPMKDLTALYKMVKILREERFDLIHLHTPKAVLLGTLGGLLAGVPHIFRTIHGFYFNVNATPSAQLFFVNMERAVNRAHHTVFSQNSEDIVTAEEKGIRRADKVLFLGNGIDLTRFTPEKLPTQRTLDLREKHGIEEDDLVLGFVGRLVIQKGMREFFEAFNRIAPSRPKIKLLLVGEVDHDKPDAVRPQGCVHPDLLDRVIEVGWQEDVEAFYPLMDVFVLPSYREGFPRTPMEASALGIPVLATDIRGCREAVEDGVNGLLVASKSVDALADGLCRILDDVALRGRLSEGGRLKAARDFDEVEKFKTVYDEYARLFGL